MTGSTSCGIGRNSDNLNNTSGVALYYNGIYYGANAAVEQQKSDLFIGNIEVDNGPQNTLHGSNSDGGVVQFTSKHPTDTTLYGEVRVGVANYDTEFVEAVVSGPINDHLKFRLGGNFTEQRGGFFNNLDGLGRKVRKHSSSAAAARPTTSRANSKGIGTSSMPGSWRPAATSSPTPTCASRASAYSPGTRTRTGPTP